MPRQLKNDDMDVQVHLPVFVGQNLNQLVEATSRTQSEVVTEALNAYLYREVDEQLPPDSALPIVGELAEQCLGLRRLLEEMHMERDQALEARSAVQRQLESTSVYVKSLDAIIHGLLQQISILSRQQDALITRIPVSD